MTNHSADQVSRARPNRQPPRGGARLGLIPPPPAIMRRWTGASPRPTRAPPRTCPPGRPRRVLPPPADDPRGPAPRPSSGPMAGEPLRPAGRRRVPLWPADWRRVTRRGIAIPADTPARSPPRPAANAAHSPDRDRGTTPRTCHLILGRPAGGGPRGDAA